MVDISDCYSSGVLDLAILGLLGEKDRHGYEIRRLLRDELGLVTNVSFGSLYPALARLERLGAVEIVSDAPAAAPSMPSTGSLAGERAAARGRRATIGRGLRSRKVYRLTAKGGELFEKLLAESPPQDDPRSFGLRLALARHLPPAARLELLERRRAVLERRLAELEGAVGADTLDPYARSVVEHAAAGVRFDISWLDGLVEAERGGAPPVGAPITTDVAP
ncbi:MAG TPA: PadR family transcriptional regulator [Acidimicrobiales bacterium]|jgi:DNA-binding PadR family transcriptional regulator|nr:PadR family transcriptional regulator [Acidimicrobiales bacterium]